LPNNLAQWLTIVRSTRTQFGSLLAFAQQSNKFRRCLLPENSGREGLKTKSLRLSFEPNPERCFFRFFFFITHTAAKGARRQKKSSQAKKS
jgi:hypothetical protein